MASSLFTIPSLSSSLPLNSRKPFVASSLNLQTHVSVSSSFHKNYSFLRFKKIAGFFKNSTFDGSRRVKSAEEESEVVVEEEEVKEGVQEEEVKEGVQEEGGETQTVSVPVSPSDTLTMHFEAEGTMSESAIPKVTKALEIEGVRDLKVRIQEGIASVGLKKQTTVQATGVASSLVELIQGSGFKLQTLNLSFEDEEDLVAA